MLATTGPFATMIAGQVQYIGYTVTMSLPGGVYPDVSLAVTKLELDASIDSDMPEGTRLEEGFSSVQGTFTLAGRVDATDPSKTAAWLFGRYSTTSPLYQTDVLYRQVTISLGLYPAGAGGTPELLTKLVGLIEDYGLDSQGNVAFTVFDLRQQFRGSVDLPAVVTSPPFNAGCTNEFVVDRLLRTATGETISSWPAQRPQCVLAVGFRSSLWPEIGSLGSVDPSQFTPQFVAGRFGSALTNFVSGSGVVSALPVPYLLSGSVGNDLTVEFWAYSGGTLDADVYFDLDSDPLLIQVDTHLFQITVGSATMSVTGSGLVTTGLHYFAVHVNWPIGGTALTATLRIDGTSYARSGTAAASRSGPWTQVRTFGGTSGIEALQVTTETAPSWNDTFTPRAVLDPSLNPLDVVPAITGTDAWSAIQQLAQSELAVAGFEGDTFRYLNRQTLRSSASVLQLTSDRALNDLQESTSSAAVVNRAQVGWTPWTFAATATTLWSAPKAHKVPAHGTWSTNVTIEGLATQIDTVGGVLGDGVVDTANTKYRVSNNKAGTSTHAPITVTVTPTGGNTFTVTAVNTSGTDAWLVSSADYISDSPIVAPGTPFLRVAGIAVTSGDEQQADYQWPYSDFVGTNGLTGAAGSRFGEILYQLTGNQWVQDEDAAAELAYDIVSGSYVSRADLLNVAITPDPRLQRCDRVQIVDTARTGVNEYALIFGYQISYEAPSEPGGQPTFTMSIDGRTVAAPGGWIGAVAGRSEGALTTSGY